MALTKDLNNPMDTKDNNGGSNSKAGSDKDIHRPPLPPPTLASAPTQTINKGKGKAHAQDDSDDLDNSHSNDKYHPELDGSTNDDDIVEIKGQAVCYETHGKSEYILRFL